MPDDPAKRLANALADRYTIERELGAGGMATVYLAEDLKHHRKVAVKVLRPELAALLGGERFVNEIAVTANLQHPHILPLYDSGRTGDEADERSNVFLYYVMPYVEGESLRDKLVREKRLGIDEGVRITCDVADALDYAHRHNVIHRDIKPENILLKDGHAVVADFGIARAVTAAADSPQITQTGHAVGTPMYMSPEQASSDPNVDGRSDLYSLGCMLYEMLSGEPPFKGATAEAILVQRFTQPPPRLTDADPNIPSGISIAVHRAMARDPADRFVTASGFAAALSAPDARPGDVTEKSIAVLPFSNMSASPEDEFFSDGMTEEIINALTQLEGLRVAARTSSFAFKGRHEDLRIVGEKLGVSTVLEGSVRRAGTRIRITAQLVNVADGYHFWSERYDREMTDIFAVQDEIAGAIAEKFKVEAAAEQPVARRGTTNLDAYELFLKGRALQYRRGQSVWRALECFERALELDPKYADPAAMMADGYRLLGLYGFGSTAVMMPKAQAAAARALELDAGHAEAYATLAVVALLYEHDPPKAYEAWQRALELNPKHIRARSEYAVWWLAGIRNSASEAIAETARSVENDPLSAWAVSMHAFVLGMMGRPDEATAVAREAVALDAESYFAQWILVATLYWAGDFTGAIEEARPALAMSGRHQFVFPALADSYAQSGNADAADAIYTELAARARTEQIHHSWLACTANAAGRLDEAAAHMRQAIAERDPLLVIVGRIREGRGLVDAPEYRAFMDRLGISV